MIGNFLDFLSNAVFSVLGVLVGVLAPASATDYTAPIYNMIEDDSVEVALSWVNYFLPIGQAATVIALWAAVMIGFVAFRLIVDLGKSTL